MLSPELEAALFRAIALDSASYISCVDRQHRILFLNRTASRDVSDIVGRAMTDFIAPDQRDALTLAVERAFTTGEPQVMCYDAILAGGERRCLQTRIVRFDGPDEQPLAVMTTEDKTEQQRLSDELERSTEFRKRIVENLPDYVVLIDRKRTMLWLNRARPGVEAANVVGKKIDHYVAPESFGLVSAAIEAAFERGEASQFESEAKTTAGTAWFLTRAVPVRTQGEIQNVLLINSDITDLKRTELALREAEQQLHRAQRLESIGQLAGGIAHDFNNLLQVIQGNLYFVRESLAGNESAEEELRQAMRATDRAAELTSQLLAIGRRKRVDPKHVELAPLVEQALRMLRRAIPENVSVAFERPVERYYVDLDTQQFEQVLINLCVNARDAMPHGGVLTIRIEPEAMTHVVLKVADTGVGISEEVLPRIFEPFFSAREGAAGSGLGLAVAAGIVAAHGGVIVPHSTLGKGTTMEVRLPRATPEQASLASHRPGHHECILVAEDEPLVRAQIVRILKSAGYSVLEAEDGQAAVEAFRAHQRAISLVLLDVVMPVLDGWQAFLKIDEMQYGTKVLFVTGYAASVLPKDFAARGARMMTKPFKPDRLLACVRDILSEGAEAESSSAVRAPPPDSGGS